MAGKLKKPLTRTAKQKDVCEALGISPRTLRDWMSKKGMPHSRGGPGKANHFNLREIQEWMRIVGLTGDIGRPPDAAALGRQKHPDLDAIEIRKQKAITEKHELQAAAMRGEFLPRADVEAIFAELGHMTRATLEGEARSSGEQRVWAEGFAERCLRRISEQATALSEKHLGTT
jgi:DNA-binding transcriptional MerR regulator